jgi:hypothetical protein
MELFLIACDGGDRPQAKAVQLRLDLRTAGFLFRSETGKGRIFVVLLSGEPQEGIKIRRRDPGVEFGYARPRGRLLLANHPKVPLFRLVSPFFSL